LHLDCSSVDELKCADRGGARASHFAERAGIHEHHRRAADALEQRAVAVDLPQSTAGIRDDGRGGIAAAEVAIVPIYSATVDQREIVKCFVRGVVKCERSAGGDGETAAD